MHHCFYESAHGCPRSCTPMWCPWELDLRSWTGAGGVDGSGRVPAEAPAVAAF